jgi:hypothetical protein
VCPRTSNSQACIALSHKVADESHINVESFMLNLHLLAIITTPPALMGHLCLLWRARPDITPQAAATAAYLMRLASPPKQNTKDKTCKAAITKSEACYSSKIRRFSPAKPNLAPMADIVNTWPNPGRRPDSDLLLWYCTSPTPRITNMTKDIYKGPRKNVRINAGTSGNYPEHRMEEE